MPLTATLEAIKTYQTKVEKNKITPDNLPPCEKCMVDSQFFKIHAYRERKFLLIIKVMIKTIFCPLVRFKCPGCGKTVTYYPDFAIPHKRYTRQSIVNLSGDYVQTDQKTYLDTVLTKSGTPAYENSERTLARSTVHRWIFCLSRLKKTCQTALCLILQENPSSRICRDFYQVTVAQGKYRSEHRKYILIQCRKLVYLETFFQRIFKTSIFTKLASQASFS
jgi:hypothetical protein